MILIQSLQRLRLRNKWLSGSCWCISLHPWILKPGASAAQKQATVLGDHSSEREVYLSCGFFVSSSLFSFLSHQTWNLDLLRLPTSCQRPNQKDLFPHSYRTRFCPAFYIIDHPFSWNLSSLPSFHALSCFSPSPSAHSFSLSSASPLYPHPHPHPYLPPLKSHHPWLFS